MRQRELCKCDQIKDLTWEVLLGIRVALHVSTSVLIRETEGDLASAEEKAS